VRNEAILPIAQFLGRAWSRKPQLVVQLSTEINIPHAVENIIRIPPPSRYPSTELISAYRLWRVSLWHESMHHNYGILTLWSVYAGSNLHDVLNIVEDYRIELKGVEEYPGMKRELDLRRAAYFHLAYPPRNIIETYAQLLLLGAVKSTPSIPSRVIDAVKYTKEAVGQGVGSYTIAKEVCKMLGIQPDVRDISLPSVIQYAVPLQKRIRQAELRKAVEKWLEAKQQAEEAEEQLKGEKHESKEASKLDKKSDKPEELDKEAEELLTAPDEVREEIEQAKIVDKQIEHGRKGGAAEVAEGIILPSKLDRDESKYYNQELITHLVSQLRKLRKGWKETSSTSGEFDIDSYVARHDKVFTDEEQLKVKGFKILILIDHSASIIGYDHMYKAACIALAEGLSTLNIPFSIYVFSEFNSYTQLYLIKNFKEKWTRMNAKRLAQVQPSGGTPLHEVYYKLEPVVMKNKGRLYFITLTDGAPNSFTITARFIKKFRQHCRMVAVAFGRNMTQAVELAMNLKELGYDKYVALDDVKKLPEKVLSLLGE
jgi:hypothetical protein